MRTRLFALALSVVSTGALLPRDVHAQLAGTWKLNAKESEDPMEKMKDMRVQGTGDRDPLGMSSGGGKPRTGTDRTSGSGSVGGGGAGGGSRSGGGGGAAAGGPGGGGGGPMMRLMRPVPQLVVSQDDSMVVMSDGANLPERIYLDGRKVEEPFFGGGVVEVTARMKDGKLTFEKKFPDGGSLKQTLSLDKSKRLLIEYKMANPGAGMSLDFKRVYDPAS